MPPNHHRPNVTEPLVPANNKMPTTRPATPPTTTPSSTKSKRFGSLRSFGSIVLVFLVALGIAVFLTVFVFQQYQVDGPSMQPTLQNGNRLIVWKVPRTWSRITGHPYIPDRGDIIIFNEPGLNELSDSGSDQLVKRVIGLPGDHIVIKNDFITIYNKQHPNGFDPDKTLSYGKGITAAANDTQCSGAYCNVTLASNQVFVCGDNRTDSLDSRIFGPIKNSQIVGKLSLRITPASEITKF